MRARLRWARQTRVTRRQMWLSSAISASVCLLILISVGGATGWDAAALNALRARQVVGSGGSGSGSGTQAQGNGSLPSDSALPSLPGSGSAGSSGTSGGSSGGGSSAGAGSGGSGSGSSGSSGSSNTGSGAKGSGTSKDSKSKSPIKHVFVISLATDDYADAFGPKSLAPYLNGTLRPRGELLTGYQSLSGVPLADSLALIGGQRPNSGTLADCPTYTDFPVGAGPNKHNLMSGTGCVYPDTVLTLGDQLDGADLKWRGYIDGMSSACQHPNSDAGVAADSLGYDPLENPFVFFHSLLDLGDCQTYDLPLSQLDGALSGSAKRAPNFVYIAADPCDGGAAGCSAPSSSTSTGTTTSTTSTTSTSTSTSTGTTTTTSTTSGATSPSQPTVVAADAFLKRVVPKILSSRGYKKDGALLIVFSATGGSSGAGTRTGALVLSPLIKAHSQDARSTNAYGVLRTIDNVFGLTPLGMARQAHPIHLLLKSSS